MNNENGRWVTIKGNHIFIKDGQTLEQAMAERFDDYDWQEDLKDHPDFDNENLNLEVEGIREEYTKVLTKHYLLSGSKETKETLARYIQQSEILNPDLEEIITYCLYHKNLNGITLRKNGSSWFDDRGKILEIGINLRSQYDTISTLNHEIGHFIDFLGYGNFKSSKYKSEKYNKTMAEMIKEELIENIANKGLVKEFNEKYSNKKFNKLKNDYADGKITYDEYAQQWSTLNRESGSICDMFQACFGKEYGNKLNNHDKDYFEGDEGEINRGSECFAEIIEDLTSEKNHHFTKFLKQYAPKTLNIFYEIMNEYYNKERIKQK